MKTVSVSSLAEFHSFVRNEIYPLVKAHTLFLLEGQPGAGKTELVKKICEILGLQGVQSPTFAFHHVYSSEKMKFQLHHVDLYRLKSEEDLESTGFWDLFEHDQDVIFIEWSNMIQDQAWPWGWRIFKIQIEKLEEDARKVSVNPL